MAYKPGDAKFTYARRTYMGGAQSSVPAYEIHFTIRGEGDYAVRVPTEGYTSEKGLQAITRVAKEICDTIDGLG